MRFNHAGVQFIDFSPCEKYLVTFSPLADSRATDEPQAIIIWDVLTGARKRAFNADKSQALPIFKWSHDDKYFARIGEDLLSVYETPSFGLLEKKSIKVNRNLSQASQYLKYLVIMTPLPVRVLKETSIIKNPKKI